MSGLRPVWTPDDYRETVAAAAACDSAVEKPPPNGLRARPNLLRGSRDCERGTVVRTDR